MNVIHAGEDFSDLLNPIFLVGPTPRDADTKSWRPEALEILEHIGFDGTVLVPEGRNWKFNNTYIDQVEWELEGLDTSSRDGCVAVWLPRELEKMPAFTTNIEFGMYIESRRFVYGRPVGTPKCSYLDHIYKKFRFQRPEITLENTMKFAQFMTQLFMERK